MNTARPQRAVIYCRVSSTKQVREGNGLSSQETRCREYAGLKKYDVAGVFCDDITGKLVRRSGIEAMLAFLRQHRRESPIVLIDDISRLARDRQVYYDLRDAIALAGGVLESPSIRFGEDADSMFFEGLMVNVSQYQREKNAEQTKNRMRARAMGGYWTFRAPIGFRFEKVAGHGKLLVRDEPLATIVAEALEKATPRAALTASSRCNAFWRHSPHGPRGRGARCIRSASPRSSPVLSMRATSRFPNGA